MRSVESLLLEVLVQLQAADRQLTDPRTTNEIAQGYLGQNTGLAPDPDSGLAQQYGRLMQAVKFPRTSRTRLHSKRLRGLPYSGVCHVSYGWTAWAAGFEQGMECA